MPGLRTPHAYTCPGCDRAPVIEYTKTTLHRFGNNGLVCTISCGPAQDGALGVNACLGQWFRVRPFQNSHSAIAEWNNAILDMAAAALGITRREALSLKERRAHVVDDKL